MIVFAVTAFVLPSVALPGTLLTTLILLGIGFGVAHLVAIYGVLRRRAWAVSLALYLLGIGLGLVAFASLLLLRAGVDLLAPAGAESTAQARPGVRAVRLAGRLVDRRRAVLMRGMAPPERRPASERSRIAHG